MLEANQGGPSGQENQPASPADNGGMTQPASPAASPGAPSQSPQENLPFDRHPRWQELQRERREEKKRYSELERKFQEQQAYLDSMRRSNGSSVKPEDEEALERVFSTAFASPKVMQMLQEKLGLNKIEQLEKQYGQLSESWGSYQANTEKKEFLGEIAKLGIDASEAESLIEEAIDSHPIYSQVRYQPGAYRAVARDVLFDKAGELRERNLNQETIQKREALKRGQTQGSSAKATGGKTFKSPEEMIKEAGGVSSIDWSR